MKNFFWFVGGVAAGFVVAHELNKTKQGKQFFSDLDAKAREFGEAMSDGYRQREAELRAAIAGEDSESPAAGPAASVTKAAASAADKVADTLADTAAAADKVAGKLADKAAAAEAAADDK